MKNEVGLLEPPQTFRRESAGASGKVRVRDDGDERQRYFLRFGFVLRFGFAFCGVVTRNGLLAKTFVRVVFISAWRSVAST